MYMLAYVHQYNLKSHTEELTTDNDGLTHLHCLHFSICLISCKKQKTVATSLVVTYTGI